MPGIPMDPWQADPPWEPGVHGITYHSESHQSSLQEPKDRVIGVVPTVQNRDVATEQSQGEEKELDG